MTRLAVCVALLATASAVTGLAWDGAYEGNDAFKAGGYRGSDVLTLLVVPFLLWAARSPSRRAKLLLPGALAYFVYAYASVALNAAYGDLFLLHTTIFGASLFGLVAAIRTMPAVSGSAPRWIARFLLASAAMTAFIWLSELAGGPDLHGSTTLVTHVLDMGVIVPAVLLAGLLLRRGDADGYVLAFPLLVLEVSLLPMITLQTAFQLDAGVDFTAAEIVGPIAGFSTFAVLAAVALRALLRFAAPAQRTTHASPHPNREDVPVAA